jgi:hypothetical protein
VFGLSRKCVAASCSVQCFGAAAVALLGRFVECAFYVDHAPYVAPMAWTILPLCCSMVASMALWWLHHKERVGFPIPKEDCNFLMLHGTCLELECISV